MQPTEDERIMAALAHASIIANVVNLGGIIATAVIWTTQRDRSAYVRAHALQALVYQGVVLIGAIFLMLFWGVCLGLSLLPIALRPDLYHDSSLPDSFWLALFGMALPIGFLILAVLFGLFGAYQAYRGAPFRYPLVGRLVRRDLGRPRSAAPAPQAPPLAAPSPGREPAPQAPTPAERPTAEQLAVPSASASAPTRTVMSPSAPDPESAPPSAGQPAPTPPPAITPVETAGAQVADPMDESQPGPQPPV